MKMPDSEPPFSLDEREVSCVVGVREEGIRLDVYLSKRFSYHSRNEWQELIRDGSILINGKTGKPSARISRDDRISFAHRGEEPKIDARFKLVYVDDAVLAVDKPGNLPCHPAGAYFKNTLWSLLSREFPEARPVHRLDRETSGVTIFARGAENAKRLSKQFADREGRVKKRYTALVFGAFPEKLHAEGFLVDDMSSPVRKKRRFITEPEAGNDREYAKTVFSLVSEKDGISTVEARPVTGRMHQIRATLRSLGFPLVGDKLYGPDETVFLRFSQGGMTDKDRKLLLLDRQALHASSITLSHPVSGKQIVLQSPLPRAFSKYMS